MHHVANNVGRSFPLSWILIFNLILVPTCVEIKKRIKVKDQKNIFLATVYFTYSPKGARMIVVEGFKFVRHYDTGEKTRWYCATHRSKGCRAALFTIGEEIVKINNSHVHNG